MSYNNNYKPSEMAEAIRTTNKMPINISDILTPDDEDKVVQNGELVTQTSHAEVTENGTYDVTINNSIIVNVEAESIEPIQVMSGPIQNPFGTVEQYQELSSKIANKEVTAFISGNLPNASQFQAVLQSSGAQLDFSTVNRVGPWSMQVYDVCWDDSEHEGPIWITDFYSWSVSGNTATMNVVTSNPNVTIKVFPYLGY